MKKILRGLVTFILIGIVFDLAISGSIQLSIDPILGSIYDHASPESRQEITKNFEDACNSLRNVPQDVQISTEGVDMAKLREICAENPGSRDLFIQFLKVQTGEIKDIMEKNPTALSYYKIIDPDSKSPNTSIALILLLSAILFLIDRNLPGLFRTFASISLTCSILLFSIYFFPRIFDHFFPIDTSFLLGMGSQGRVELDSQKFFLVLFPLILMSVFSKKLVIFAGGFLAFYLIVSIGLFIRKKLINDNSNSEGPIAQLGRAGDS